MNHQIAFTLFWGLVIGFCVGFLVMMFWADSLYQSEFDRAYRIGEAAASERIEALIFSGMMCRANEQQGGE